LTAEMVRRVCLGMPGATESLQWGEHLVFKIGGKMFAIANLDFGGNVLSFKCTPEDFAELIEREGIIPGPHLARAQWVALENWSAMPAKEINTRLRQAYELVRAKLPAKVRAGLA
jgi:predicted DNA-binding protein (MmcQ/YjbR family)